MKRLEIKKEKEDEVVSSALPTASAIPAFHTKPFVANGIILFGKFQ